MATNVPSRQRELVKGLAQAPMLLCYPKRGLKVIRSVCRLYSLPGKNSSQVFPQALVLQSVFPSWKPRPNGSSAACE